VSDWPRASRLGPAERCVRRMFIHTHIQGATTGGGGGRGGGSGPPQILLGPLQLFGQLFSWGVQSWLNHLAVLHVHQAMTDDIDLVAVARDFISKCDSRLTTFGQ
jgi:hypothetical protein